jgi:hypothetical protein
MTHSRAFGFLFSCVLAACTASVSGSGSDPGQGSDQNGSDTGSGSGSDPTDPDANVLPTYPVQHPRILLSNTARHDALVASLQANTPAAARFRMVIDGWVSGVDYWGMHAWEAALMGQLTGDPKYCAKAIAVTEAQVVAAEAAIAAGQSPDAAVGSYYAVGEDIGDIALTYDWCFDTVSASQKTRWLAYANQTVSNVWNPTTASYGGHSAAWTGWAVDDPSDNYYYGFLRATMLLGLAAQGDDATANQWIAQFRDTKILGELVPIFDADLAGGGSREGTGYGVAMRNLFALYDFWHATTGEQLASKTKHTRACMRAFVNAIVPTLDRFAPTGDQSRDSTASMFDYQRNYLQELVAIYPQDALAGRVQQLLASSSVPAMGSGFMAVDDFLYDNAAVTMQTLDGMGRTYYATGIGELYTRSSWDTHATWVNLIAGPYTQSHAHQDQGSLMIYKDGWLAYDAVVGSYSGLPQATTAHGLVRIDNGGSPVTQVADTMSSLVALHSGTGWLYAASDLTPAYNGKAQVGRVQREIVHLEPDTIVVYDRVTSAAGTQQTWQMPTPVQPSISGTTATISGSHVLHVERFAPAAASASVHNMTSDSDFTSGFRLDETVAGGDQRYLHVLSIDGAVTSSSASGDTVTVQLASGHSATIAFDHDAIGASITYDGVQSALSPGIDSMPQ